MVSAFGFNPNDPGSTPGISFFILKIYIKLKFQKFYNIYLNIIKFFIFFIINKISYIYYINFKNHYMVIIDNYYFNKVKIAKINNKTFC